MKKVCDIIFYSQYIPLRSTVVNTLILKPFRIGLVILKSFIVEFNKWLIYGIYILLV